LNTEGHGARSASVCCSETDEVASRRPTQPRRRSERSIFWLAVGLLLLGCAALLGLILGSSERFYQLAGGLPQLVIAGTVWRCVPPSKVSARSADGPPLGASVESARHVQAAARRLCGTIPYRMVLAALPCALVLLLHRAI
jgi:hypothetical protein